MLGEALEDPRRRDAVIRDCVQLIDDEVASKRGLSGAGIRAGYKAFVKLRPNMVRAAVKRLLPDFVPVIDPQWERGVAAGDPHRWFREHDGEIADGLLAVTDGMASHASNRVLLRLYRTLRTTAREHVRAGVPKIPTLIERHL
jgi:hypothetical protein